MMTDNTSLSTSASSMVDPPKHKHKHTQKQKQKQKQTQKHTQKQKQTLQEPDISETSATLTSTHHGEDSTEASLVETTLSLASNKTKIQEAGLPAPSQTTKQQQYTPPSCSPRNQEEHVTWMRVVESNDSVANSTTPNTQQEQDMKERKHGNKTKHKKEKVTSKKKKKRKTSSSRKRSALVVAVNTNDNHHRGNNNNNNNDDDDGIGIDASGLDETFHHRKGTDPPGDLVLPKNHHNHNHKDAHKPNAKTSSLPSKKKSKKSSSSDKSSTPTPDESSSTLGSSSRSEWDVARERLHKVAASPHRGPVFLNPAQKDAATAMNDDNADPMVGRTSSMAPMSGSSNGLLEVQAHGLQNLTQTMPPPPPLVNDDATMITESGIHCKCFVVQSLGTASELSPAPASPSRVNVRRVYTNSLDDKNDRDQAMALSFSMNNQQPKPRALVILDDEETGVLSSQATLHAEDEQEASKNMNARERFLFIWCRLFMLAGILVIFVAIIIVAKDRRAEQKSVAVSVPVTTLLPTSAPTVPPTALVGPTTTQAPSQNIVLRKEWVPQGQVLYGQTDREKFGFAVSISADGSTLAVGALQEENSFGQLFQGYVQVFRYDQSTSEWTPFGQELEGEAEGDDYGYAVSLSRDGKTLATSVLMGNSSGRGTGIVRIFRYNEGSTLWEQLGQNQFTGLRHDNVVLSDDGNTVACVEYTDQEGYQRVHVYLFDGTDWDLLGDPLGGHTGNDVSVETRTGSFPGVRHLQGTKNTISTMYVDLSANGRTVAVGGDVYEHNDDGLGPDIEGMGAAVKVLQYSDATSNWERVGQVLFGDNPYDGFGAYFSLSSDGKRLATGSPYHNNGDATTTGKVQVYEYDETSSQWVPLGQTLLGQKASEKFGHGLALSDDGNVLIASAPGNSGLVRAFGFDGASKEWVALGDDIVGLGVQDEFGHAVALSGDGQYLVGSSPFHDTGGEDSGHVRVFRLG